MNPIDGRPDPGEPDDPLIEKVRVEATRVGSATASSGIARLPVALVLSIVVLGALALSIGRSSESSGSPDITTRGASADATATPADRGPDVTLALTFPVGEVRVGQRIHGDVTLTNSSTEAVSYLDEGCGNPASIVAAIQLPFEPAGQSWDGQLGVAKEYIVHNGTAPGIVPASGPLWQSVVAQCASAPKVVSLGPGDQVSSGFDWTPELAPEIGIAPGTVPVRAVASLGDPPSPQSPTYREITAESSIQIVGEAPSIVSAGQAVDAALASDAVSRWLSNQDPKTWSGANLWLDGTGWHIELFSELGVPRTFASVTVDPEAGTVTSVDICDAPCTR